MLKLPNLRTAECKLLTVCGSFEDVKSLKAPLRAIKNAVLAKSKSLYIACMGSADGHLHFDLVGIDAIREPPPPELKLNSMAALAKLLRPFYGHTIKFDATASFAITPERFPEVINRQMLASKAGQVSLEIVAGTIKVTGAPFDEISWWIIENGEGRVRLQLHREVIIGDKYFVDTYALLESGFQALVSEATSND